MMRCLNWISAKSLMSAQKGSHESRSTHSLSFVFILWCFFEFISSKIVISFWNTMDSFFIVKVVVASSQQVKCSISLPHGITVNTHCYVTMGMWCYLGNYVTSQWVGDVAIDTKQSCDKQPGSFIQDPGGMKTWIFQLKNMNLATHHRISNHIVVHVCEHALLLLFPFWYLSSIQITWPWPPVDRLCHGLIALRQKET